MKAFSVLNSIVKAKAFANWSPLAFAGFSLILLGGCGESPIPKSGPKLVLSQDQKDEVLRELGAVPVQASLHSKSVEHAEFYVRERHSQLPNCSVCHTGGDIRTQGDGQQAHWDIQLQHSKAMNCQTCHDVEQPQALKFGDQRVSMDHSYQLCSSCHFQQEKDFRIGAHGKRLTGWAKPRVVKNCTECHDPHQPHFKADGTVARPMIVPTRLQNKDSKHE